MSDSNEGQPQAEDIVGGPVDGDGESADGGSPTPRSRKMTSVDDSLPDEELDRIVEALLFASADSLTPAKIGEAAGGVSSPRIRQSIERLQADYQRQLRSFAVLEVAGGFKLYSRPEYQEHVAKLDRIRAPEKLTQASLETLAIVAYRQPMIRAEVDAIRGVQTGPILRSLLERKLIRVVGRSDQPGRPLLYGTSKRFLEHFGLASLKDLPRVEELKAP